MLWTRIHHNLDRFPVLDQFKGRLGNSGATREMLERLMIGINVPTGSPLVRTWELARDLERRGKMQTVRDLFAAGSSVTKVVDEILESHTTTAGAATVYRGLGGGRTPSSSQLASWGGWRWHRLYGTKGVRAGGDCS